MFDDDERGSEILKKHSLHLYMPASLVGAAASVVQINDFARANFATPRLFFALNRSRSATHPRVAWVVLSSGEFASQLSVALTGAMAGSRGVRTTSTTSEHCWAVGVEDSTLDSARAVIVSTRGDLLL